MENEITQLEPREIWKNFAALNAVPRPSKKEDKIVAFMMDFGSRLGLETLKDATGNVIIRKPGTRGLEGRKMITLQSHLDMVHQKNAETPFNFDTQGIQMFVDGDWVKARGTTLGADNGLGVAAIMALLESRELEHPPLEALFTVDEETGMTGAMGLQGGVLRGEFLLNLDTEDDSEIDIGCAGGIDITATLHYREEAIQGPAEAYRITVKGLHGGHSGMDIHRGYGNANRIMNRMLYAAMGATDLRIATIEGGGLRNAIPRESYAHVVVSPHQEELLQATFSELAAKIRNELRFTEPNISLQLDPAPMPDKVLGTAIQSKVIKALYAAHNGVYTMSAAVKGLVETSNNLARVAIADGVITIKCLTRSAVESSKMDLAHALKSAFELAGCEVTFSGSYPGWDPKPDAEILKTAVKQYTKLFKNEPDVMACHAGLECGILGQHYPKMEMISFGPTIKGAHSPDERVSISSVVKFWKLLLAILQNAPQ